MSLNPAMNRSSAASSGGNRAMRATLWAAVVVQAIVCLLLAELYASLLGDPSDASHFIRQANRFPMSAMLTAALLTIGIIVTALSAVGMLKRARWAPFPYVVWISVAATENIFHSVLMLRFPFVAFPFFICVLYLWALRVELNAPPPRPPVRSANLRAEFHRLRLVIMAALAGLFPPLGLALSPFAFFAGLFEGGGSGVALVLVSLVGYISSILYFLHLAYQAFGAGA